MRVYVDSSALIKRAIEVASSLAWVEVTRAIRARADPETDVNDIVEAALSGIAERSITTDVVSLARRIGPRSLRRLDAVHLATAVLVDAA